MTRSLGKTNHWQFIFGLAVGLVLALSLLAVSAASAITKIPDPDPKPGSFGLEATKTQPPPKQGARISSPRSGQSFSESPITVQGICPTGLLVEVHNNGVMVGAVMCENGSFKLEISLFDGKNDLSAIVYDNTDQAGPKSNVVSVNYRNTQFSAFGELVTLTSQYSRRAASINKQLNWPLQLSGGTGPYAFTIDWGDGTSSDLKSQSAAGSVNINHVYARAGIYHVNIKVTDKNGVTAFLQLIAVANGAPVADDPADSEDQVAICRDDGGWRVFWIPVVIVVLMLPLAYWLGRRSKLISIRRQMEKERDRYQDEGNNNSQSE